MPVGTTSDIQAINQRPAAPTPTAQAASPAERVVVPKAGAPSINPNSLAGAAALSAGAGVTIVADRKGYGPNGTGGTLIAADQGSTVVPILGPVGAPGGGAQSADAGAHTVWPSQFSFPTTKFHNAARLRGMT